METQMTTSDIQNHRISDYLLGFQDLGYEIVGTVGESEYQGNYWVLMLDYRKRPCLTYISYGSCSFCDPMEAGLFAGYARAQIAHSLLVEAGVKYLFGDIIKVIDRVWGTDILTKQDREQLDAMYSTLRLRKDVRW
jgi:hypothetical protein